MLFKSEGLEELRADGQELIDHATRALDALSKMDGDWATNDVADALNALATLLGVEMTFREAAGTGDRGPATEEDDGSSSSHRKDVDSAPGPSAEDLATAIASAINPSLSHLADSLSELKKSLGGTPASRQPVGQDRLEKDETPEFGQGMFADVVFGTTK